MWASGGINNDTTVTAKNAQSLLAWSFDSVACVNTNQPTAATIYLAKIPVPYKITVATIGALTSQAGTGATPLSNCQFGLYSSAGVLIASSADQVSSWNTGTGYKTAALVVEGGQSLTLAGSPTAFVWGAIHIGQQATTPLIFRSSAIVAVGVNAGVTAASFRFATQTGHITNTLTTIGALTPASNTTAASPIWMTLA